MRSKDEKLLKLLSNNDLTFYIPPYQRNYDWDEEQCEVFYNDVIQTADKNVNKGMPTEHFFGTLVYSEQKTPFQEPDILVLTDGQQRITTSMLFLAALRDTLEDSLAASIDRKYLKNENVGNETQYKIKLKQVESDWETYKRIILREPISLDQKESQVYKNYKYFLDKLHENPEEKVSNASLLDEGLGKFRVVEIELDLSNPWENPQEIFESMNSLGKPLSLADLVRNWLLMGETISTQEKLYHDHWLIIEKRIPGKLSDFIRDFMQLYAHQSYKVASNANHKTLYAEFKRLFTRSEQEELFRELAEYSEYYRWIVFAEYSDKFCCGNPRITRKLWLIQQFSSVANSFVMGLLKRWKSQELTDNELEEILTVLVSYLVRRSALKLSAGTNKSIPPLAKQYDRLTKATDKGVEMANLLSELDYPSRLPNDSEFAVGLASMDFYHYKPARLLLSLLEEKLSKAWHFPNEEGIQIEHILPQKLSAQWKRDLGADCKEIHQTYVNVLGNLTLIRFNQELGYKPFEEKKEVYRDKSDLTISRRKIVRRDKWSRDEILTRQKWLIEQLTIDVAPIPDEFKEANNWNEERRTSSRRWRFNMEAAGIVGEEISFGRDPSIKATVLDAKYVMFNGKKYSLSALTRQILTERNEVNRSGGYEGSRWWRYQDSRLSDLPNAYIKPEGNDDIDQLDDAENED